MDQEILRTVPTSPLPTPLPPAPSPVFWSSTQWAVMMALMEAICPSIASEGCVRNPDKQVVVSEHRITESYLKLRDSLREKALSRPEFEAYLTRSPTATPEFFAALVRSLVRLPERQRRSLAFFIWLLSTRLGSWILTGHFQPFHALSAELRHDVVRSWSCSRFTAFRMLAKSFVLIANWITTRVDGYFLRLSGYPDIPLHHAAASSDARLVFEQCSQVGKESSAMHVITTDVVIVGSGCGGATCADILSKAGYGVVVVDKAYHVQPSHMPMSQSEGSHHLYENHGFIGSDDMSVSVIAGSAWGGGGTVNWGVSLQTQDFVRREWAEKHALPRFVSDEYQQSLDRVCDAMGVSTDGIRHNHRNKVLLEACDRLGWAGHPVPVNSAGGDHYCGQCHLGCRSGGKRGPIVTSLPAAAARGARLLEGFDVDKVTFEDGDGGRVATGICGTWTSRDTSGGVGGQTNESIVRKVEIRAKKVILSAGALWSPILLLRSGIKNPLIGTNLHLHPCQFVVGYYDQDTRPWEGSIITSCVDEFENLDGHGHGVKLEPTGMIPYSILSYQPWRDSLSHKTDLLRYRTSAAFIALTRDRDSGRVFPDPSSGRPRIAYTTSDFDRAHTLEGVVALAKACYVTGAREIRVIHHDVEPFVVGRTAVTTQDKSAVDGSPDPELSDPLFAAWLRHVRHTVSETPATLAMWGSAHQMGSCRMSGHGPRGGVVDPHGRVWGTDGLFVADASVLPSASAVNPMITVMAVADGIARAVGRELAEGNAVPGVISGAGGHMTGS